MRLAPHLQKRYTHEDEDPAIIIISSSRKAPGAEKPAASPELRTARYAVRSLSMIVDLSGAWDLDDWKGLQSEWEEGLLIGNEVEV